MNGLILSTKFNRHPIDVCIFSDEPYFYVSQIAAALEYARPENLYTPILHSWRAYFEPGEILKFDKKTAEMLALSTENSPKHYSFILLASKYAVLTLVAKSRKNLKHSFRKFIKDQVLSQIENELISESNLPEVELTISSFLRSKNVPLTPTNRRTFGIAVAQKYRKKYNRDPVKVIRGRRSFNTYSMNDLEIFERAFAEWQK